MNDGLNLSEWQAPQGSTDKNSLALDVEKEQYYQSWLFGQTKLIPGLQAAMVKVVDSSSVLLEVASLTDSPELYLALVDLTEHLDNAQQAQITSMAPASSTAQETFALIYPLYINNDQQLIAVVAMAVQVQKQSELERAMALLQYSIASIEVLHYQNQLQQLNRQQNGVSERVDILARILSEPDYQSAAVRLVTELAVLFNCDRVSLGEYKNNRSRLKHLSHSTQFGKRMNLVQSIEQVMDECIDQNQSICYPRPEMLLENTAEAEIPLIDSVVFLAHRRLSQQQGDACVLSIPLYMAGSSRGALVLEGNPDVPFTDYQANLCQSITSLVMPALEDKRLNDRALLLKIFSSGKKQLGRLLGAGYLGRKLFFIGIIGLCYFLYSATGNYRLSADARLESAVQRAIVSPYDGYIQTAQARAGDRVNTGDVLVRLDNRDMHLERLKWLSEKSKLNRQYQEALATHDRAKINIINAQQGQVAAQLELVDSRLDRAELKAPFKGLIVSGDLSQRLGSAVNKGEVLLKVSPDNNYRISLLIKESRIADLKIGQRGSLYLSALPEKAFDFTLSKITPLTETQDGATYYIAEGKFTEQFEQLQPGMEGIGKISIDERKLVDIWSREAQEWMRLQIWSWWG
ncbi:MAG: HlyD family efflux transporter periplasmic adaptor subunit [Oceanospirillaceae bacterium]|nr:HlyD family efflux transporter periplasmic adaptor subunit [Oceanospirillaceae bacterium]